MFKHMETAEQVCKEGTTSKNNQHRSDTNYTIHIKNNMLGGFASPCKPNKDHSGNRKRSYVNPLSNTSTEV